MKSVLLTGNQFDYLVKHCAYWMEVKWATYAHQWVTNGVIVSGTKAAIENLKFQLPVENKE